jgi:hypothetical protein
MRGYEKITCRNMNNLKPGDKLLCIKPRIGLQLGHVYTFDRLGNYPDEDVLLYIKENEEAFYHTRFVLATKLHILFYASNE